jgi:hypothetical protein
MPWGFVVEELGDQLVGYEFGKSAWPYWRRPMAYIRMCMLIILMSGCAALKMVADEVDGDELPSSRQRKAERERVKEIIEAVDGQLDESDGGGTESLPEQIPDESEPD